jgi:hypothetical protein
VLDLSGIVAPLSVKACGNDAGAIASKQVFISTPYNKATGPTID